MEVIVVRDGVTKVPVDLTHLDEEDTKQAVLALVSTHGAANVLVDGKSFADWTAEAAPADGEKPGKLYEQGDEVPTAGTWEITGPRGGHTGSYLYLTAGELFPPVPEEGQHYALKQAAV